MTRRFALPEATRLALVAGAAACSSADVVGVWAITDLDQGGTALELPYVYDDVEGGAPVSVYLGIRLAFEDGGVGAWQTYYDTVYEDGSVVEDPYDYETTWRQRGRTFRVESSGGIDLDMDCTVDEDELSCDGTKDGGSLSLSAMPYEPR
jgi:hypothetical protein